MNAVAENARRALGVGQPEGSTQPLSDLDVALLIAELIEEVDRLHGLLTTPRIQDFIAGAVFEAAHQSTRWDDSRKGPVDWLGVACWLAGKAARAMADGDLDKARHHTISTAALCANWHAALDALKRAELER